MVLERHDSNLEELKRETMTVANDLRAAAQYMREHGHTKYTAENAVGAVCALGAIAHGIGAPISACYGRYEETIPGQRFRFDHTVRSLSAYLHNAEIATKYQDRKSVV